MELSVKQRDIAATVDNKKSNRTVGTLSVQKLAARVQVYNPSSMAISDLLAKAHQDLPMLACPEVVQKVAAHNPDSLWVIQKKPEAAVRNVEATGFLGLLLFNELGHNAFLAGELDLSNPPLEYLIEQHEKPVSAYIWAIYAKGRLAPAFLLIRDKLQPKIGSVELFARPVTEDGKRTLKALGFGRGFNLGKHCQENLYHYRLNSVDADKANSIACTQSASYDTHIKLSPNLTVKKRQIGIAVVHDIEEYMQVASIRAAVYMSEQDCPYEEEFDGNDFAAAHLVGYIGKEPAGCIRIRYFADFAKIERLAVRKEFRKSRLSFKLVRAAIELCRAKGYKKLYGHSQKRLVNFWSRFGFHPLNDKTFMFSGFEYVEMVLDAEKHEQAIQIGANPYVIIRPEGQWDRPGVLEFSAQN